MSVTLLVVEDNVDLRESLQEYLETEGFTVVAAESAEEAVGHIEQVQLAVIDINLPGKSGFSLVQDIRSEGLVYPLIALTARDQVEDKLRGFELGLTDYVVKPFSLAELSARIKAHLRQHAQQRTSTSRLQLNADRREVLLDGRPVTLTGTEFRLLEMLMQHNRTIVSFDDLVEHAWGTADLGSDPPVRIHMRNLRKKLDDHDMTLIRTVSGLGYMLDD